MRRNRGELFVKLGLVTDEQLVCALATPRSEKQKIEDILVDLGLATRQQIVEAVSSKLKIPVVSCAECALSDELRKLVPMDLAKSKVIFPLEKKNATLVLAMSDPLDYRTIDHLAFRTRLKISPVLSDEGEILSAIERCYANNSGGQKAADTAPPSSAERSRSSSGEKGGEKGKRHEVRPPAASEGTVSEKSIRFLEEEQDPENAVANAETLYSQSNAPSIVNFVSMIIAEAVKAKASDIHIEPRDKYTQGRFRIDGELRNIFRYDKSMHDSIVSRVKIISHLDITNRRLPQDGSASIMFNENEVDLRISTAPSIHGEKIVIRLLDKNTGLLEFDELSMSEHIKESISKILKRPQGMLIVTGPTGSGKTTTLYSCLNQLRSEKRNIVTIEDPVEYKLDGITQIQIDEAIGRTFSLVLRSVLRQDPDVIKIGEIRDLETAEIAIKAALTGHFVLTTLHTNNTIATITRLLNIGIPAYLISSAISGILAQRLIRRICVHCREEREVPEDIEKFIGTFRLPPLRRYYCGTGCEKCGNTGYSGRVAVYEYLPMTPKFRRVLVRTVNEHEFLAEAKGSGFTFLFEDAWSKVLAGITTFDEVISKIPIEYRLGMRQDKGTPEEEERRKVSEWAYYDELDLY